MFATAVLEELNNIINSAHGDPHHVLGMHEITLKGEKCVAVRAFIPPAKSITVIDNEDDSNTYEMSLVHTDGFFEVVIEGRQNFFMYKLKVELYTGDTYTTHDPYSFQPTVQELDMHLFGEGTHYQIYDKLGAHPTVINNVEGVAFAVWAPNARRVSVIGDFNGWDGRRHQMRVLSRSGIWEIFIPGLKKYDRYKFEVKTQNNTILEKQDPYGNFGELRPGTCSLVYDIKGFEWHDENWLKTRSAKSPLDGPLNIYEVHLGSWRRASHDGDRFMSYLELADELIPYVKEMGYTHIELMPVTEHPFDGSWGYQVTGYYAVTSRFGNPHEFMYFVDCCHRNNIGVIMDWVPAHFPKDAHGLARFDGTALFEHENPKQGEHPEWGTLIFNYGRPEVKNFLIGNAIFWAENYHIDGFRVDAVASMLYLDYAKEAGNWVPNMYGGRENLEAVEFLKHLNSVILGRFPNLMMIAEESTSWPMVSRPAEHGGLGFNLKWNMGWMNDFLRYVSLDSVYRKHHHQNLTFGMMYAYTENFVLVLSHDEVVHGKRSLINKMPGDTWQKFAGLRVALGFMFGHPGKKLLFMGSEFGQFIEWDERRSLDWFLLDYESHRQMQKFVKDLNLLYRNDRPMWYDDFKGSGFEWLDCNDAERSVVSFMRKGEKETDITIFVCNFTPVPLYTHRIGVPLKCSYQEVLNSDDLKYGGSGLINYQTLNSESYGVNGKEFSVSIVVPPLGVSVIKPVKGTLR